MATLTLNNPTKKTDLAWLSWALAWMNADVLRLEEIRRHANGLGAMDTVDTVTRRGADNQEL
jgi:hypothetical protein